MRFVIFAHFSPSIPPRGVVAISPLFHFRRGEIFVFALVGDIYPSYENETLFSAPTPLFFRWCERKQRDGSGKKENSTFSFFNLKFNLDNINEKKLKIRPDIKLTQAD